MKILMVCQYYWPDNFLINEIAEELVKRGNKVTVLTGLPDYSSTKIPEKYKHGKNRIEKHNGVNIIRVPIIARHHGLFMRVLNYMSFMINSTKYVKKNNLDCDIIFSYQLAPIFMVNPAMKLKHKINKPLFLYVLDLWPDQMKVWHVGEKNPIFKIVLKYCKKAYGSGDIVGITSKPFENYLINVCDVDKNKILYIPQHSDRMNIKITNSKKDQVDLIFAGNIGKQQNLECLLNAISKIKTNKKYMVHIYGDGTSFKSLNDLANKLSVLDRVKVYGRVDKKELNQIYSKMDAFLLTLCSSDKIGFVANTVPAKLQNYMSAGKPIIASIDGGAYDIIKESNCGLAVHANDVNGFAKIIKEYIEHIDKYKICGKNAIDYFNKNFEKEIVIDKIENVLKNLMGGVSHEEK